MYGLTRSPARRRRSANASKHRAIQMSRDVVRDTCTKSFTVSDMALVKSGIEGFRGREERERERGVLDRDKRSWGFSRF